MADTTRALQNIDVGTSAESTDNVLLVEETSQKLVSMNTVVNNAADGIEISSLETDDKTLSGAINALNSNITDLTETLSASFSGTTSDANAIVSTNLSALDYEIVYCSGTAAGAVEIIFLPYVQNSATTWKVKMIIANGFTVPAKGSSYNFTAYYRKRTI